MQHLDPCGDDYAMIAARIKQIFADRRKGVTDEELVGTVCWDETVCWKGVTDEELVGTVCWDETVC